MNPLTVTWPPILYTSYGQENFNNWIEIGGLDNVTFKQNGKVIRLLTKLSIENLLHPFQTFILGQKNIGPRMAARTTNSVPVSPTRKSENRTFTTEPSGRSVRTEDRPPSSPARKCPRLTTPPLEPRESPSSESSPTRGYQSRAS